jgi:hypothetical protein
MFINFKQKLVVITPPRAGSTRLKQWLLGVGPREHNYEKANDAGWIMPFRHGEFAMLQYVNSAHGVPETEYQYSLLYAIEAGHDPYWRVVYMLRQPVDRLYSLWLYMQQITEETHRRAPADWRERNSTDAKRPFEEWLLNSQATFNEGAGSDPRKWDTELYSRYCTQLSIPASRKNADNFLDSCPRDIVVPVRYNSNSDYMHVFGDFPPEGKVNASKQEPMFDTSVTKLTHERLKEHFAYDYKLMEMANARSKV